MRDRRLHLGDVSTPRSQPLGEAGVVLPASVTAPPGPAADRHHPSTEPTRPGTDGGEDVAEHPLRGVHATSVLPSGPARPEIAA